MKKLLIKLFLLFIIVSFFLVVILILPISVILDNEYKYFSLINNKTEIIKNTKSPKIIFVSGSSLFAGLSAKKMTDKIKISSINMGLFIGFGLKFPLDKIKPFISNTDIIVIIPEYNLLFQDDLSVIEIFNFDKIIFVSPLDHFRYICRSKNYKKLFLSYIFVFQKKLENIFCHIKEMIFFKIPYKYDRLLGYSNCKFENLINNFGDNLLNTSITPKKYLDGRGVFPEKLSENQLKIINDFNEYANLHGAKVYFMFSNLEESEYKKNERQIKNYYNYLKSNLNIKIISTPDQFYFPYEYYYDTVNHLNALGREKYTDKLIEILKNSEVIK